MTESGGRQEPEKKKKLYLLNHQPSRDEPIIHDAVKIGQMNDPKLERGKEETNDGRG